MNSEVVRSRSYSIDEADVIESDQSDVKFMKVSTPQSVRQPRVGVMSGGKHPVSSTINQEERFTLLNRYWSQFVNFQADVYIESLGGQGFTYINYEYTIQEV